MVRAWLLGMAVIGCAVGGDDPPRTADARVSPDPADPTDAAPDPSSPDGGAPRDCPTPCPLAAGVCLGALQACDQAACDYFAYTPGYQVEETADNCDTLDNDCDGSVDEACACTDGESAECGGGLGACSAGTRTCVDGAWAPCAGEALPSPERCNGIDDDCDGGIDEEVDEPPPCANQVGVCTGSVEICGGADGWRQCDDQRYNRYDPRFTPVEGALNCDAVDNDCDGTIDEGCECAPDETRACGSDVGACQPGTESCRDGLFADCTGRGPRDERCNGDDNDCDGRTDEDAECPEDQACRDGGCVRVRWVFEAEARDAGHAIGRPDGNGWSANTDQDPAGYLLFGPYTRAVPAGRFTARFRMQVDNNNADDNVVARIEVNDFDGRQPDCGDCVIVRQGVRRRAFRAPRQDQDFALSFDNPGGRRLEFRLFWRDIAYVRIDRVEVVRAD